MKQNLMKLFRVMLNNLLTSVSMLTICAVPTNNEDIRIEDLSSHELYY